MPIEIAPHYQSDRLSIYLGDMLTVLAALEADSIDSVVTDPPYELGFMGKSWDNAGVSFQSDTWRAAYRVLKPGGHMLVFGGTRTFHRIATAIEDAGFEHRDTLMWLYGSGFPKSLDVSKAIDKAALPVTAPATDDARKWAGWGTALKPAWEPIIMCRKPLSESTVAANVLLWGTGGINIGATRIEAAGCPARGNYHGETDSMFQMGSGWAMGATDQGRWPANLCLDEEAAAMLDEHSGISQAGVAVQRNRDGKSHNQIFGEYKKPPVDDVGFGDIGGASRFFYTAKASRIERKGSKHPTVKPLDLMRWLVRLVTPINGVTLDPFAGSGTTLEAALNEGMRAIGVDLTPEYLDDEITRITSAQMGLGLDVGPISVATKQASKKIITTKVDEDVQLSMTMTELDTIELDGISLEDLAQAALWDGEQLERTSAIFLPGFKGLGLLTGQPVFDDSEIIDAAYTYYRTRGFPYRVLAKHVMMQQINQLAQTDSDALTGTTVGYGVADTYHPHRFAAEVDGKRTPLASFESDKYLRMAIEKTLKHGAIGEEFLGMMALVANTQACSNFRPGFALSYYRRFYQPNWTVLDTSTGYGGRLVGFLATNTRGTYIGIDPNKQTHAGNVQMMRDLGEPKGYKAIFINMPAEDVPLELAEFEHPIQMVGMADANVFDLRERADFSFTSPPYFSKEHYAEDDTQSWVRYGDSPEHWNSGFLQPMLRLQFDALKPGAYSCINIADVKIKNAVVPLSDMTVAAAEAAGFVVKGRDNYKLQHRMGRGEGNRVVAYEPVHIFQKPERRVQIVVPTLPIDRVDPRGICERANCGHIYAKHDEDDGYACLKCECKSFSALLEEPDIEIEEPPETPQARTLFVAPMPSDTATLCGESECSHMLAHHEEDEDGLPCLKRGCECKAFAIFCVGCGARNGEYHRDGCTSTASTLKPEAASAPAQIDYDEFGPDVLTDEIVDAANKAIAERQNTEPGVVDEQAAEVRKILAEQDAKRQQSTLPSTPPKTGERRSASPTVSLPSVVSTRSHGEPTPMHKSRTAKAGLTGNGGRPLRVSCDEPGCGAASGEWCAKEAAEGKA